MTRDEQRFEAARSAMLPRNEHEAETGRLMRAKWAVQDADALLAELDRTAGMIPPVSGPFGQTLVPTEELAELRRAKSALETLERTCQPILRFRLGKWAVTMKNGGAVKWIDGLTLLALAEKIRGEAK